MAEKCYELIFDIDNTTQNTNFVRIEDSIHWIPQTYCYQCGSYPSGEGFPVPEAEQQLSFDNDLLLHIDQLCETTQQVRREIMEIALRIPGEPPSADDPLWQREYSEGSISPVTFHDLAEQLRMALSLPAARQIYPGSRISCLKLKCLTNKMPDILYVPGAGIIIAESAQRVLVSNSITGWKGFPLNKWPATDKEIRLHSSISELIILGNGGIPANMKEGKDYNICHTCGFLTYTSSIYRPVINTSQWDGSDMLHFTGISIIYVTEHCKDVLEDSGINGISFE